MTKPEIMREFDEAVKGQRAALRKMLDSKADPEGLYGALSGLKLSEDGEAIAFIAFSWGDVSRDFFDTFRELDARLGALSEDAEVTTFTTTARNPDEEKIH
jgi:hypothetical protein